MRFEGFVRGTMEMELPKLDRANAPKITYAPADSYVPMALTMPPPPAFRTVTVVKYKDERKERAEYVLRETLWHLGDTDEDIAAKDTIRILLQDFETENTHVPLAHLK
ncbi:MAG: hypothetical protein WBL50_12985 [Candidatus Acidiferrum sp.]